MKMAALMPKELIEQSARANLEEEVCYLLRQKRDLQRSRSHMCKDPYGFVEWVIRSAHCELRIEDLERELRG